MKTYHTYTFIHLPWDSSKTFEEASIELSGNIKDFISECPFEYNSHISDENSRKVDEDCINQAIIYPLEGEQEFPYVLMRVYIRINLKENELVIFDEWNSNGEFFEPIKE